MNIKEIKKEFGDCDFLRATLNEWTVEAIQYMINKVEELENINEALSESLDRFNDYS